jgi:serine/threonine protein kinase
MPRGSLHDVLHDPKVDLPLTMKLKFARDIALAMNWLHCSHPPIIHRDLKPTNVLVDENYNLKVCDFGLSAIKRQEKLQDNGVAPGTPLWMSPEVLRGRPLNEKADIYSFGIVLWEILTRKEPFENHDSYNSFVHAICDEKERPPIPADVHPSLKRLMEVCWHEDPEKRPLFTEVLELLDDATIRSVLEEDDAQNLWRKFAKGMDKIPFTSFARGLYATLGYGTPDELSTPYQCLKLLIAHKSQRDHEESVSLEMFSLFLRWFGGLRARSGAGASQGNILDRVKTLCEQEWFHGNISREESEQKLATEKKGSYLIRLSLTEPEKTPYTISKVNQKGIINHQRVSVNPGGAGYYVTIKYPDKPKKFEAAGPIGNLIKLVSKELSLKYACAGSMFSSLFQKQEKFGGYLQDDD